MARSPARLQQMARNHHAVLIPGPPAVVTCERCGHSWEAPLTKTGKPTGEFWLCANSCNLSAARARRRLKRHEDGDEQDPALLQAARDRVLITADAKHYVGQKIIEAARDLGEEVGSRTMHAPANTPVEPERQVAPVEISDDLREALFEHFTVKWAHLERSRNARVIRARTEASRQNFKLVMHKGTFYLVTKTKYFRDRKRVGLYRVIGEVEDRLGIKQEPVIPDVGESVESRVERLRILARRNRLDLDPIPVGKLKGRFALRRWTAQEMTHVAEKRWKKVSKRVSPDGGYSLDELEDFLGWDVDEYVKQAQAIAAGSTLRAPVALGDGLTMGGEAVSLDDLLDDGTT